MSSMVITRNEDVNSFIIGNFSDKRLLKTGALLFKRIATKMTTSIKKLAGNRALQVAFCRFLSNSNTSVEEIQDSLAKKTNDICVNKDHVLCIQDTVEINYSTQPGRKFNFGKNRKIQVSDRQINGFMAHPGLIVDANNNDVLGLSSIKVWTRTDEGLSENEQKKRPIEEKESYKWIETAQKAKANITNAKMLTIIGDRENDIYEFFDRIPDQKTYLIVRSRINRQLSNNKYLKEYMDNILPCGTYKINLPAITGIRESRIAELEIKYSSIEIKTPARKNKSEIINKNLELNCIEVYEINTPKDVKEPIFWRLITTHDVNNFNDAKKIVGWYSSRWNIEQIFRTLKKRGFKIEDSAIEKPEALFKLFILSIAAAVKVLCLVKVRDGSGARAASDLFSEEELKFLVIVSSNVNGNTKKQQNPYEKQTLSWASWIIARLGGWNGYACERPAGPITMYDGLEQFKILFKGWHMAQKDVCIR